MRVGLSRSRRRRSPVDFGSLRLTGAAASVEVGLLLIRIQSPPGAALARGSADTEQFIEEDCVQTHCSIELVRFDATFFAANRDFMRASIPIRKLPLALQS